MKKKKQPKRTHADKLPWRPEKFERKFPDPMATSETNPDALGRGRVRHWSGR